MSLRGKLPRLAVDSEFNSEAYEPDQDGVYTVVEYSRNDGTLYMRSTLSRRIESRMYAEVTLAYFDKRGEEILHQTTWKLHYDINKKIVSKRMDA